MRTLPPELVSLVHHVELNKSGWWDTAVERLVLTAIWLAGGSIPIDELPEAIRTQFGTRVDPKVLAARVDRLAAVGTLLRTNGRIKVAEARLEEFERDRAESERLVAATKARFVEELNAAGANVPPEETWEAFAERWLVPTICSAGARTYELVSGNYEDWSAAASLDAFLGGLPAEEHAAVRHAVARFLDPKDASVRACLLRMMDAYFIVEASRLSERTVEALAEFTGRQPSFTLFLDTNILFSLLGLHGEDSQDAAMALIDLSRDLSGRVKVRLYTLPATIDETRAALQRELQGLRNLRLPRDLARAALHSGDLGEVAVAYAEAATKSSQTLTPEEFLSPYIGNLVSVLRERSVEIYNTPLGAVAERPEVQHDIDVQEEFERSKYAHRAKSRAQITHDVVLWHVAHAKRPPRVESPADAGFWLVTEDYRLIGFDMHKRGGRPGGQEPVPVCLQPLALVQVLQFWTGRTERMEEALMGGLRLSLIASDFDPSAEQTTITILETLARYENVGDLPHSSVAQILVNEALREKLSRTTDKEERVALVRDELLAEYRRTVEALERTAKENAGLAERALNAEDDLVRARLRVVALEEEKEASRRREQALADRLAEAERRDGETQTAVARADARRTFVDRWLIAPAGMLALLVFVTGHFIPTAFAQDIRWTAPLLALVVTLWLVVAAHVGRRNPHVANWGPHRAITGAKKLLFGVIGAVVYGVLGNIATDVWWKPITESTVAVPPGAPPARDTAAGAERASSTTTPAGTGRTPTAVPRPGSGGM